MRKYRFVLLFVIIFTSCKHNNYTVNTKDLSLNDYDYIGLDTLNYYTIGNPKSDTINVISSDTIIYHLIYGYASEYRYKLSIEENENYLVIKLEKKILFSNDNKSTALSNIKMMDFVYINRNKYDKIIIKVQRPS